MRKQLPCTHVRGSGASQGQYVSEEGVRQAVLHPQGLYLTSVRQERWLRVGPTQLEPPSLLQGESTGKSRSPTTQHQPPPGPSHRSPRPPVSAGTARPEGWQRGGGSQTPLLLLSHFSRVRLCATPESAAHQAPPPLEFSRQEHWSGVPFPSPVHEREK